MKMEDFPDDLSEEEILKALYNGELDPELAQDLLQYYQDEPYEQERLPVLELLDKCVFPTWSQTIDSVFPLLTMCFIYKALICIYPTSRDSKEDHSDRTANQTNSVLWNSFIHVTGAILGLTALHMFFDKSLLYLVVYNTLAFVVLTLTYWKFKGYSGFVLSILTVIYLLVCELVLTNPVEWHKIRGSQMVLSMKVISLAFDLDSGSVATVPDVGRYLGYSFHVGSVIFGPWVSYGEYQRAASNQSLSFSWLRKIIYSGVLSMVCVVVSSCLLHWLILNDTSDWLEAYRDAQSFRFSHYFVSLMSEVTVVASGVGFMVSNGEANWDFTVTRPWHIEFPRSLVEVVTNWNLPMHTWLRHYVFRNVKPAGNFIAILLTYAASSLLHGLNFQLAAVLLSLGFYTYVEFVLRKKLSRIFNACIQAKRCKPECGHFYKSSDPYVIVTNTLFAGLTVFHLAYLGLMFDSSDQEETGYTMGHTLDKWSQLDYASHWFALGTLVFHILI